MRRLRRTSSLRFEPQDEVRTYDDSDLRRRKQFLQCVFDEARGCQHSSATVSQLGQQRFDKGGAVH